MSDKKPLHDQEESEKASDTKRDQEIQNTKKPTNSIFSMKFVLVCVYGLRAFVQKIYARGIVKMKRALAFYKKCRAPIDIKSSHSPYFFHSYKVNVILDCSGVGFLIHDWTIRYFQNETLRQTLTLRKGDHTQPDTGRLNTKVPIYILGWCTWKKDFIQISSSMISTKTVEIDSDYAFHNAKIPMRSVQNQNRKVNIPAYSIRDRFRAPLFRMSSLEIDKIQQEIKQEKK